MAHVEPGACVLCGCTDWSPCLGGALFPGSMPGPHRMVDENLFPRGETCMWVDEDETVCSAHSAEELRELFDLEEGREATT